MAKAPNPKTVEALIVPQAQHCSSNGTRAGTCAAVESSNWQEGKAVTRRAWTFKLRRRPGAAYNLFFRAISKDGTQSSNFNFRISMPR